VFVLGPAVLATIDYLWALSQEPASDIVPLVATSPAVGGLLGAVALHVRPTRWQYTGMALGISAAALLAVQA
jgi:drug/metabolite transporter (DMT)-like permease